jgi:23S rRNA (cytosine1962-C5)-methyltransferase
MTQTNFTTSAEKDYELLDSGRGEKLERFGKFVLSRPDPQALWQKNLSQGEWDKADGVFRRVGGDRDDDDSDKNKAGSKNVTNLKSRWKMKTGMPEKWQVDFAGLRFLIEPTPFKHVGLFPEQKSNWEWMEEKIKDKKSKIKTENGAGEIKVLNLFGYTGGATLACAAVGASVVHVDGSKVAVTRAKENAKLSGLEDRPIRWMLDDVRDFVKRELRRGNRYDGIIMDPPSFGRGDKGQVWKIEEDFISLFDDCLRILSDNPIFFLINGYAAGYSPIAYYNNLLALQKRFGGAIEAGELTIEETKGKKPCLTMPVGRQAAGRQNTERDGNVRSLPCGIFARWSR